MNVEAAPQSWSAALVDIATIGAMLIMALNHVQEPAAWTLLGSVVAGRFGVSLGKSIERTAARSGDGGPGGPGGSGRSGSMRAVQESFPVPQKPPSSGGSSGPTIARISLAKQYAIVAALAISIACVTIIARFGLQIIAHR